MIFLCFDFSSLFYLLKSKSIFFILDITIEAQKQTKRKFVAMVLLFVLLVTLLIVLGWLIVKWAKSLIVRYFNFYAWLHVVKLLYSQQALRLFLTSNCLESLFIKINQKPLIENRKK